MRNGIPLREPAWSESIAVGGKAFIENIRDKLGIKGKVRKTVKNKEEFILNEPPCFYKADFAHRMGLVSLENMYYWDFYNEILDS